MRLPELPEEEREEYQKPSMNTHLRVKKTRDVGPTDPKAKKRTHQRRKRNTAKTRQIKEPNLTAAVKAEKRVDPKAGRGIRNTKIATEEGAPEAKTEKITKRKQKSPNLIKVRKEISVLSLIKNIEKMQKEEMVRESGQSHEARKDRPPKMGTDQIVEAGIRVDLQCQKTRRKSRKKTERGTGSAVGVQRDGTMVKGRIRGEGPPGTRIEQGARTETGPETLTGAGAPGARVTTETIAKSGRLIERIKTENLPTAGDPRADAAAAQTVAKRRKGGAERAPIPRREEQIVGGESLLPNPGTAGEAREQIAVQKAETETSSRGIDQAPAPALTIVTEPVINHT